MFLLLTPTDDQLYIYLYGFVVVIYVRVYISSLCSLVHLCIDVLAVWNYCTLSQKTIGMFAFGIYDKDHSGNLSPSEVEKMIRDIYGKKADTSVDVKHVCAELKKMGKNEKLDDLRFNMFAQTHHNLLYPAWFFQEQLQQHVINQSFWGKKTIQRSERSSQGYASLDQIIGKDYSSKKRFSVG